MYFTASDFFDDLPSDLRAYLFSFIPFKERLTLRLVCRQWKIYFQKYLTSYKYYEEVSPQLASWLSSQGQLRELEIHSLGDNSEKYLSTLTSLHSFSIYICTADELMHLLMYFTNLRSLTAPEVCEVSAVHTLYLTKLHHLESLSLETGALYPRRKEVPRSAQPPRSIHLSLQCQSSLRKLILGDAYVVDEEFFRNGDPRLISLEELVVDEQNISIAPYIDAIRYSANSLKRIDIKNTSAEFLQALLSCSQLECLSFAHCTTQLWDRNGDFAALMCQLTRLEALSLPVCIEEQQSTTAWRNMCSFLTRLRSIECWRFHIGSTADLELLTQLKQLSELNIHAGHEDSPPAIALRLTEIPLSDPLAEMKQKFPPIRNPNFIRMLLFQLEEWSLSVPWTMHGRLAVCVNKVALRDALNDRWKHLPAEITSQKDIDEAVHRTASNSTEKRQFTLDEEDLDEDDDDEFNPNESSSEGEEEEDENEAKDEDEEDE